VDKAQLNTAACNGAIEYEDIVDSSSDDAVTPHECETMRAEKPHLQILI